MTALGDRIAALIASQGPISVAQYMTLALHDPREGYYATRDPLGETGDFITAPEISQMFGEMIGLWLTQTWHDQGKPARPLLVELGPGRGSLMRDVLRTLKLVPSFRAALDIVLVEASPVLRAQQEKMLSGSGVAVRWAANFLEVPDDRPLFLVANEFFDALPIAQYVKTERGWCERKVTLDGAGALAFALSPVPLPRMPADLQDAPRGGFYETSAAGESLAEEIGHRIAAQGGAALIVDYGHDTPGFGETLQAVVRHVPAGVLAAPGRHDLSAHVDFRALSDAAVRSGASVSGPVSQGEFLSALGVVERAKRLAKGELRIGTWDWGGNLWDSSIMRRQLERLILPEQMGTLFKALAILPKSAPTPPGF